MSAKNSGLETLQAGLQDPSETCLESLQHSHSPYVVGPTLIPLAVLLQLSLLYFPPMFWKLDNTLTELERDPLQSIDIAVCQHVNREETDK